MPNSIDIQLRTKTRFKVGYLYSGYAIFGLLAGMAVSALNNAGSSAFCPSYNEAQCAQESECQSIFREDRSFSHCIALTQEELEVLRFDRQLCQKTGGAWQRIPAGAFCNCSKINKTYSPGGGCK